MSTATTLSREPEACGVGRFRKEAMATTTSTAPMAIRTILAGGRFFFAVPYSSPMLIVGPLGAGGAAWGEGGFGGGVGSGIGFGVPRGFYACTDGVLKNLTAENAEKSAENAERGKIKEEDQSAS